MLASFRFADGEGRQGIDGASAWGGTSTSRATIRSWRNGGWRRDSRPTSERVMRTMRCTPPSTRPLRELDFFRPTRRSALVGRFEVGSVPHLPDWRQKGHLKEGAITELAFRAEYDEARINITEKNRFGREMIVLGSVWVWIVYSDGAAQWAPILDLRGPLRAAVAYAGGCPLRLRHLREPP